MKEQLTRLTPALLECAAVWLALRMTLPPANRRRWAYWGGPVVCTALHLLVWLLAQKQLPDGFERQAAQTALPLLLWLVYAWAAYEGTLVRKLAVVAILFAAMRLIVFQVEWLGITAFGMRVLLYPGYNRDTCISVMEIISRCFVLALCMGYGQLSQQRRELKPLSGKAAALVILLPLVGLGGVGLIAYPRLGSHGMVPQNLGLWALWLPTVLAMEAVLVLGVGWTRRALALQRQCRQQLQQQEKDHSQTEELREMFANQRIQTHEYRNRLTVLSMLLAQQQYDEADAFLQQLTQYTYQDSPTVQTNHPIADAVLNLKYAQAREQHTAMRFMVGDLSSLPFTDDEVVKLLGNLLDNALEACRKLETNREIDIKLQCQGGGIVLSVRNPLPPEGAGPRQDTLLHGFGLQTVDRVLKHHQIPYAITQEYGWFQFTAMSWPDGQES